MANRYIALVLSFVLSSVAHGQDCTAWLNASDGNDQNPGTQTQPLRSFEFAFESLPEASVVCMAAGEYFFGEDADGIRLEEAGKSMTFRLQAFAGATEIRFSESEFVVDIGTGVLSVLNESADNLVIGHGVVNLDDPQEASLLNFVHTLSFLSGEFSVSGIELTLEPSVGNPSWQHPSNPLKVPPTSARIEFSDGLAPTNIDYEAGERSLLVNPVGNPFGELLPPLPPDLTDVTLRFSGPGNSIIQESLTLSGAEVAFEHSGNVEFRGTVRVDLAKQSVNFTDLFSGSVSFENELVLFNSGLVEPVWNLGGTGNVSIATLLSEGGRTTEPTQTLRWESSGDLSIERATKTALPGSMEPLLGLSVLSGRLFLGNAATVLAFPGPLEISAQMTLRGIVHLSADGIPLTNTGSIDLAGFELRVGPTTSALLNNGTISGAFPSSLAIMGSSSLRGSGSIDVDVAIRAPFSANSHVFAKSLSVSSGGILTVEDEEILTASGLEVFSGGTLSISSGASISLREDLLAREGSSLSFSANSELSTIANILIEANVSASEIEGRIRINGTNPTIFTDSPASTPPLLIEGVSAVVTSNGGLPELSVTSGSVLIEALGDFTLQGNVLLTDAVLTIETDGAVTVLGSLTLDDESQASVSAPTFRPGGDISVNRSALALNQAMVVPISGSTIVLRSDAPVVLPSLFLADTDATIIVEGEYSVLGSVLLSSGEIIINSGAVLYVSGDIVRTEGIFEAVSGGLLNLDGATVQEISGFSTSVLPSISITGAGINLRENTTVLGSLTVSQGVLSLMGGSTLSIAGSFTQTGGSIQIPESSNILVTGDWTQQAGLFSTNGGTLTIGGNIVASGGSSELSEMLLRIEGPRLHTAALHEALTLRALELASGAELVVTNGQLSVQQSIQIPPASTLSLGGGQMVLGSGQAGAFIDNDGTLKSDLSESWLTLSGDASFILTGGGRFGALKIDLSNDNESVLIQTDDEVFKVIDDVFFSSGSIDLNSRSLLVRGDGNIPEMTLNLADDIDAPGSPDGRGFKDMLGPFSFLSQSFFDLRYTGQITSIHSIGPEFLNGSVNHLTIEATDPVNDVPVFGLQMFGNRRISGRLLVEEGAIIRLDSGTLDLTGNGQSHFVRGVIAGDGTLRISGSASPLFGSATNNSRIGSLEVDIVSTTTASVISNIRNFDTVRIVSGAIQWAGDTARIGNDLLLEGGQVRLTTQLEIGESGQISGSDATLIMDEGSHITLSNNTIVSMDASMEIVIGSEAAAASLGTDGFFEITGASTVGAPSGIPRLKLNADHESAISDNVFLSSDLKIDEWLELVNGDLFVGEFSLVLEGGALILDSDFIAFDGEGDGISGDFSGQLGRLVLAGNISVQLGSDIVLQSIDLVLDSGLSSVSLESLTATPHSLTVSNRPFFHRSGLLDLGINDLILNGAIERVLQVESGTFSARSQMSPLLASMAPLQSARFMPLKDDDFGEIVVRGAGNTSLFFAAETILPHLRISGNVRLDPNSAPLVIGNRFVFGQDGASFVVDTGAELHFSDQAVIVRRGRGSLSVAPVFLGIHDVFYELDDGNVTGLNTGFSQSELTTGNEFPPSTTQLGVLGIMGGNHGGTTNRIVLADDVQLSEGLIIHSGQLDLNGHAITLLDGALFALDQIDVDSPGQLVATDLRSQGFVDVAIASRSSNVDLTLGVVSSLSLDEVSLFIGRIGAPVARTIRLSAPLSANSISIVGTNVGDSFRLNGNDLQAISSLDLESVAVTSTQVASVGAAELFLDNLSTISGPISTVVQGDTELQGAYEGLLLDVGGDLLTQGVLGPSTTLRFSGDAQSWTIANDVSLNTLIIDQSASSIGVPGRINLISTSGPVEISVTNELQLKSGLLLLNEHSLLLSGSESGFIRSVADGSASHLVGRAIREAPENSTDTFVYPVGSSDAYRPLSITMTNPLLSSSRIGVAPLSMPYVSRSGFPLLSVDQQLLLDVAPFSWVITSSVNFAQSQPVILSAQIPESVVSAVEGHRLISRAFGAVSLPWSAVSGTPVLTETSDAILLRNIDALGLLTPQGIEIGIGLPTTLFSTSSDLQFVNLTDIDQVDFSDETRVHFQSTLNERASLLTEIGYDNALSTNFTFNADRAATHEPLAFTTTDVAVQARYEQVLIELDPSGYELRSYDLESSGASPSDRVELWFAHAHPSIESVSVSMGLNLPFIVASELTYGGHSSQFDAVASEVFFSVSAESGDQEIFSFDLTPLVGSSGVLFLTRTPIGSTASFELLLVGADAQVQTGLVVTGVGPEEREIPTSLQLKGNYPNPFSFKTSIVFDLPETSRVTLQVFDMLGRRLSNLEAGILTMGTGHVLPFNGSQLASGTYFYIVSAEGSATSYQQTGKMVLIR